VQTESGVVKGKFRYMAPEQAAGEATQASDLFSMGVLLFELLTGMRLFDADHEAGVLNQVLSKKIPAPTSVDPHVPQTLSDVILRATDRDPNRRFPSAAAMGEEWRAAFHRNDQEQVQRFVRGLLGDSLQAKLTLVEEAERTSSANAERTIHVAPPAPAASEAWEDAPTVEDAPKEMSPPRPRTIEAVLPSPRTSSPPAMMAHSEVTDPTHVAFETEVAAMRRRPSRRTLAMVLAGVGLLVALFIGAQLSGPTEPLRTGSPPSASPTVSLAPSPSAVISPTPTAATSSKGPAVADRSASTAVASSSAAPVVPHPLGKGAPDCRTPFYIDKDGVRVYRRECL
jgi:serine/threonine-protein kinase